MVSNNRRRSSTVGSCFYKMVDNQLRCEATENGIKEEPEPPEPEIIPDLGSVSCPISGDSQNLARN
jgi:hypothetical protein